MKKRLRLSLLPVATLLLEILPYGAALNFARPAADGSIGYVRSLCSYFDPLPFGYANFAPLITAVLTCVLLLLTAGYAATGRRGWKIAARNLSAVCALVSLCPLLLGIRFYSVVGGLITATLLAEFLCLRASLSPAGDTPEE